MISISVDILFWSQITLVVDAVEQNGCKIIMYYGKAKEDDSSRFMHKSQEILNGNVKLEYLHSKFIVLGEMKSLCL